MIEYSAESRAEVVDDVDEKKSIRVLHADDELVLLKIARRCLEMKGPFQVDTASSVEEAIGRMEKEDYDAVVSDFQMPGKNGLEFLRELRHGGKSVPFVMFTGKGSEELAIRAMNLGADHYLSRTGDPETVYSELAHAIRSSVKRKKAEETLKIKRSK
jgi:DNA-binding response OmpR family regulator